MEDKNANELNAVIPVGIFGLVALLVFAIPEDDEYMDWKAEVISTSTKEVVVRQLASDQTTKIADGNTEELEPGKCVLVRQNVGFTLLKRKVFILERSVPCERT